MSSKIEEVARDILKGFALRPDAVLNVTEKAEPITQMDLVMAGGRALLQKALDIHRERVRDMTALELLERLQKLFEEPELRKQK